MDKICETCLKNLVRRTDEQPNHFRKRRFCNRSCANKGTKNIIKYNTEIKWQRVEKHKSNSLIINQWLGGKR